MLLEILKGSTVFSSAAAIVVLLAALVEDHIARSVHKDPDYLLALGFLRPLCKMALAINLLMLVNYVLRFHTGLPGGTLPGPETNSEISLFSLTTAFCFFALLGASMIWLLRSAEAPDEEELKRRREGVEARLVAERARAEKVEADGTRRQKGGS